MSRKNNNGLGICWPHGKPDNLIKNTNRHRFVKRKMILGDLIGGVLYFLLGFSIALLLF